MSAREFLQSDDKTLSMSKLLMAGSFLVSSFVMLKLTIMGGMTEGYLTIYLGCFAGAYVLSKGVDMKRAVGLEEAA